MRKIVAISINASIAALLFSGCASNNTQAEPTLPRLDMRKTDVIVDKDSGLYYQMPAYSSGMPIDEEKVYVLNVFSNGLLQCKKHSGFIKSIDKNNEVNNVVGKYFSILTDNERSNLISIPKRDSKEFHEVVETFTTLARSGQIACISPMAKTEVKEYKTAQRKEAARKRKEEKLEKERIAKQEKIEAKRRAEQEKINNDPRVVAARIQAEAIRESARIQKEATDAQTKAMKSAAYKARQQQRMQSYSQNIKNIMDSSDRRIQMHQLGYTLTH